MNTASDSLSAGSTRSRRLTPSLPGPIVTIRGLTVVGFVLLLLSGPVPNDSDIVAAVLALSLLAIVAMTLILAIINALRLKRSLRIIVQDSAGAAPTNTPGSEKIHSRTKTPLVIRVEQANLFPFFSLQFQLIFEHPGVERVTHIISGKALSNSGEAKQFIRETLRFPHRGIWRCTGVHASFGDQLGLTKIQWPLNAPTACTNFAVAPPITTHTNIPILSSCKRSGDLVTDINEHQGDPFDLKPYHPSDGMKKILWKIYAKTGELVSRHPERSMTPEGKLAIFCFAKSYEENTCGAALAYFRMLEDLNLELSIGCEGMTRESVASSSTEAEELLVDTAWRSDDQDAQTGLQQLQEFISEVKIKDAASHLDQVVIFVSQGRIAYDLNFANGVHSTLENSGVRPIYCVISPESIEDIAPRIAQRTPKSYAERLLPLLIEVPEDTRIESPATQEGYHSFLDVCRKRNWQVILE